MRRFVKYITLFLLPVFVFMIASEFLLRNIPNDYKNKRNYLDEHSEQLEVLFLGASHTLVGLNPDYFSKRCYNAAYVSQTIDIDFEIYKKYALELNQVEYIILPISYCTLFEQLETISEYWRIINYNLYYDLNIGSHIKDYSEILGNKLWFNMYRMMKYYVFGTPPFICTPNGWEKRLPDINLDMEVSGRERAKLHTIDDPECFAQNVKLLRLFIEYAGERNVQVILYTSPAYESYVKHLNTVQLQQSIDVANEMATTYPHVSYYNFLTDTTFVDSDFFDSDHLNESGAKKLSVMLNEKISLK